MSSEYVAKHREDIVHRKTATEATGTAKSAWPVKAKLVVLLSLLRIMQHVISLCGLLEFLLGFLAVGIAVGVIFYGKLSISFLYLVFGCVLVDAEHLVIISFCHFVMCIGE